MAKLIITKNQIKQIIQEHKDPQISEAIEKWAEKVLTDIIHQIQEEQELRDERLATKEDLKLMFETIQKQMDSRFEAIQKQMDSRFEKVDERFEYLIKEMNLRFEKVDARFEAMQKETNARFEAMQKETNARFEAMQKEMNARFEAIEKRFSHLTWTINLGFIMIAVIVSLLNYFK